MGGMKSPIAIKHYHFTEISVKARDVEYDDIVVEGPYPSFENVNINTLVTLAEAQEGGSFLLTIEVGCAPEKESTFPYEFKFIVEGIFESDSSEIEEEKQQLIVCNGASMLYGCVREQLISLTSRQKYGPLLLPATSFQGLRKSEKAKHLTKKSRSKTKKAT
ncbi:Uncharacterised protein [Klebsiella pneumoniae]|nr:hypothetical protein [Klebsiella pneumoniae]SLR91257.1 Uncharacterised protein [Klebsiella pneumoniae]SLT26021.1 Uncharacterised protein [Klebsiella pneumoniae]SLT28087.1 Uncharacterised protein [Klebsiella pneumoniae]SLT58270.1 Uncharacterised protein [Klebsiella pneumoniae]